MAQHVRVRLQLQGRQRHNHYGQYALVGDSSCASGFRKALGKENHGFAVHHRPVPLAHDLEIRGALAKRRAGPPAVGLQKISGRGEYVGNAVPEIDVPVAVIVEAIFHVRGWQKLRLADLASVGTDQVSHVKIAALDDL